MSAPDPEIFYARHLPHYQPPHGTFFTTFRLAGSLPAQVIEQLKDQRKRREEEIAMIRSNAKRTTLLREHQKAYFEKFDALLDGSASGPHWLADERVASCTAEAMHFHDGKGYDLLAYTVMPNHVHLVCTLQPEKKPMRATPGKHAVAKYPLTEILQSIKRFTAKNGNRILQREGQFWQHESYDHLIRNSEELLRILYYTINNPVKARLCGTWHEWEWTYLKQGLI